MEVRRINTELYHHGVKGQRWGVRRYQNPDGTLTDAGKKRFHTKNDRITATDTDNIGESINTKRAVGGVAGFGTAAGLLAASAIMSQPILAVPALAVELGVFAVDGALKKTREKKINEAKQLMSQPQNELYKLMESTRNDSSIPISEQISRVSKLKAVSNHISEGERAGKRYIATSTKDGGLNIESDLYREFRNKNPKLSEDELSKAFRKKYGDNY